MNIRKSLLVLCAAAALAWMAGASDSPREGTLFERLGGKPAVQAVVDDLVARILADARVNRWFEHAASSPEITAAYKAKLTDFICQATGGPCKYAGKDMEMAHKGRGITEDAFNAVVQDLIATLDKFQVPAKEKTQVLGLLGPLKSAVVESKSAQQ
jgi:hemoglobin